jgi:hypothetical protein
MITLDLLVYADLMLLTRLFYLANDGPLSRPRTAALGVLQIVLLVAVFAWNAAFLAAVVTVTAITVLALLWQSQVNLAGGYRLLSLLALLLVPAYVGSYGNGFQFNAVSAAVAAHLGAGLPWLQGLQATTATALSSLLFGFLMLANETNIGIRATFHHLKLEPRRNPAGLEDGDGGIDRRAYNAGRVIGILERWLMFMVVVAAVDLSALGFIIAAKGLARLKQLEDRQFAEYMLVGTLLSAVSAVVVGFWIRHMLLAL